MTMIQDKSPRALIVEMFEEMVERKNAGLIEHYYHPGFVMETNGQRQDFAAFAEGHRHVYATGIRYAVRYDEEAWVEAGDRLAARLWIETQRPGAEPVIFEVVLIAIFREGRIYRLWETTSPDWRQEKAFESYEAAETRSPLCAEDLRP